jgi:hypothetical protein
LGEVYRPRAPMGGKKAKQKMKSVTGEQATATLTKPNQTLTKIEKKSTERRLQDCQRATACEAGWDAHAGRIQAAVRRRRVARILSELRCAVAAVRLQAAARRLAVVRAVRASLRAERQKLLQEMYHHKARQQVARRWFGLAAGVRAVAKGKAAGQAFVWLVNNKDEEKDESHRAQGLRV